LKAVILAGGMGKRLKPLTDNIPKVLVPINNIPIIKWQIKYFEKFGVDEFVICTGYKGEQVKEYLESEKNNIKSKIHYSQETEQLGTGGAIKNASKFLCDDSFFVINGDVITNLDPTQLKSKQYSIASVPLRSAFGTMNISQDDNITVKNFKEKGIIINHWMNAGIYHLSNEILKDLPDKGNIEDTIFPNLAKKGKLSSVKYPDSLWHSIDSHKNIEECSKDMMERRYNDFIERE
jgi:mannose-1-phosphate guanylyltransferase